MVRLSPDQLRARPNRDVFRRTRGSSGRSVGNMRCCWGCKGWALCPIKSRRRLSSQSVRYEARGRRRAGQAMCSAEHVQRLSKRGAVDRKNERMGWNAPGRSSFLGNFACAADGGCGRPCIHQHGAANALSTIRVDSTQKGLPQCLCGVRAAAGRGTGPRAREQSGGCSWGVGPSWDNRGALAAQGLCVSESIRLA